MHKLFLWFESRLNLRETVGPMLLHPIPRGAAGPMGWWYVFGSASMTLLMIQVLTGIGLGARLCSVDERSLCEFGVLE